MAHIHTGTNQHDLTVTAYILRTDTQEPKALLHMHKKLQVLLPVGGHVELDETPWQAAAHEIAEESGYELYQLRILQPVSRIMKLSRVIQHPYPLSMNTHAVSTDHFHTDIQYGFVTSESPRLTIDEGESADLRWVTRDALKNLGPKDIFDNAREVYEFLFDEALTGWERVETADFSIKNSKN